MTTIFSVRNAIIGLSSVMLIGFGAESARAQYTNSTVTPRFGGGYTINSYDSDGNYTNSTATPRFGGGYNINTYDSDGNYTNSTVTPRFGGGFNINTYGY